MPSYEDIENYILTELELEDRNINIDDYFDILKAYKRMLKTKKTPEYSLVEYEYIFKSFYEDYKNKIYKDRSNIKEIIGGYGELLFYNKLLENTELEVSWVSRYHGDKFGFDFVTYNEVTKEYTFYEVKTTVNKDKLGEFFLTKNEHKKYERLSSLSMQNENIKYVIANILIDDKGIRDEVDYIINDNILEFIEHHKTVITENNNKTKSHGEEVLTKRIIQKPIN